MADEVRYSASESFSYGWFDISLTRESGEVDVVACSSYDLNAELVLGTAAGKHNHFKLARWSPDGSSVVTSSQDRKLRVFFIPPDVVAPFYGEGKRFRLFSSSWNPLLIFIADERLHPITWLMFGGGHQLSFSLALTWFKGLIPEAGKGESAPASFTPHLTVSRSMPATSLAWYPFMDLYQDASSGCFLVGSSDHPIHLVDGVSGEGDQPNRFDFGRVPSSVRGSYPVIDHRERYVGPTSITFHPEEDGKLHYNPSSSRRLMLLIAVIQVIYCGYENAIQVMDLTRPGWMGWKQPTSPSRKAPVGQKGLISSIDFQPGYQGEGASIYGAGSFAGTFGLYDERHNPAMNLPSLTFPNHKLLRGRGITHLQFSPTHPHLLYVGARRASAILEYDIRQPNYPKRAFDRPLSSDQRLAFDVRHNHLAAGDQHGVVSIFDLGSPNHLLKGRFLGRPPRPGALGSTQFHPTLPLLLTASGSRLNESLEGLAPTEESNPTLNRPLTDESFLKLWRMPYKPKLCTLQQ
ncbi:hypothetical protein L0F63_000665 [Massospora cicadina]|nr:hypothetical protein L0F63_000665 [Massospora cicadina]